MTEKETCKIIYDKYAKKLYLIGSFLPEIATFREQLASAIYREGEYEKLTDEEIKGPRVLQLVIVNCPGGGISDMFALVGVLRMFKKDLPNIDFHLHCLGQIQSAATIFMATEVFSRVTLDKFCTIKIHNVQTSMSKDVSLKRARLILEAQTSVDIEKVMCQIYKECAEKRGKSGTNWQGIIDEGDDKTCFSAQDVLSMGLCDEIS